MLWLVTDSSTTFLQDNCKKENWRHFDHEKWILLLLSHDQQLTTARKTWDVPHCPTTKRQEWARKWFGNEIPRNTSQKALMKPIQEPPTSNTGYHERAQHTFRKWAPLEIEKDLHPFMLALVAMPKIVAYYVHRCPLQLLGSSNFISILQINWRLNFVVG